VANETQKSLLLQITIKTKQMKKQRLLKTLLFMLCAFLYSSSFAQEGNTKLVNKPAPEQLMTFSKQSEKDTFIKQLEDKLKINLTDPSYPAAEIEKQKKELIAVKKAKITKEAKK
jgi:cytochrome c-type biogenesis protein CcmH/NrfG